MKQTIQELRQIIATYTPQLQQLDEAALRSRPRPDKWSRKEELGHLCDSAQSNIRRFVVGQYEEMPHIVYDQEKWVTISNYQEYDNSELISFWMLLNRHICRIWENTPPDKAARQVRTQDVHTIDWLAADYNRHLLHHLHHLLDLEPIAYP